MSHELKNNASLGNHSDDTVSWQPTALISTLHTRAKIIADIRAFFAERDVLEVETPQLARFGVSDPHIQAIRTTQGGYLQTSPEYHMKRLLAAGSGSIYQIGKCFRHEEQGRLHNNEFTMLEWYRVGFDHVALMEEVDLLLQRTLQTEAADRMSYQACFERWVGEINPHTATGYELAQQGRALGIDAPSVESRGDWLDLLQSHVVEPQLGLERPVLIYDYPADQAALARVGRAQDGSEHPVALRFEAYYKGVELANGYFELIEGASQRARFEQDRQTRRALERDDVLADLYLLGALDAGLPSCAGVALGLDRLLMLRLDAQHISEVMSFMESF